MSLFQPSNEVFSPCIGVCTLDHRGWCSGCLRTADEIGRWMEIDDSGRQAIMDRVAERVRELEQSQ